MAAWLASWESLYANSAVLRTLVGFAHVAGLLVGGGAAIVADRAALRIGPEASARAGVLQTIQATHRIVISGLALVLVSGVLLLGADSETLLHSAVFWTKMGLVALLVGNGVVMSRAERAALSGVSPAWTRLRWTAAISLALWLLVTLAGAALPNVA